MKEMDCPICGNRSERVLNLFCCQRCGWNIQRARRAIRRSEFSPYVLIVVGGLLCLSMLSDRGPNSLLDITVLFGIFVALGLLALRRQKRWRALIAGHTGETVTSTVQAAVARLQKQWEWLLQTLPPREIQLTHKGRNNLIRGILGIAIVNALLAVCIIGNWWALQKQHGPLAERLVRPIMIFFVVLGAVYTLFFGGAMIRYHAKARRLLAHGKATMGKIVQLTESSSKSVLNIEFLHPSGEIVKTKCTGLSAACFEGMTLPVFCDPLKPRDRFVFIEGGDYQIIRPGLSHWPAS